MNPPYSETEAWIDRAIELAEQKPPDEGIYVLLPVRPDTKYQANLLKAAFDVLLMEGRPAFLKEDGTPRSGTGERAIMIVGLNISTRRLIDAGLAGLIVIYGEEKTPKDDYVGMQSARIATLVSEGRFAELERSAAPDSPEEETALHALIATIDAEQDARSSASRAKVKALKAKKASKKR